MVVLDEEQKKKLTSEIVVEVNDDSSLREERKRTGRYAAAGTAIFLCLLGLYEAFSRGTPQYAALFLPAVIMFIYVLWILHVSRKSYRMKTYIPIEIIENTVISQPQEVKVIEVPENPDPEQEKPAPPPDEKVEDTNPVNKEENPPTGEDNTIDNTSKENPRTFCRTYSVA